MMISPARCIAFSLALLCASAGWAQGITSRTVVLGQSAPLSGPQRALGEEVRNGALAFLRRLNDAGGVHGRRVELATLDDAGEPERALANTRRFIEEFGVFALLAYPDASATGEVLDLAHEARMPVLAPVSGYARARRPGRSTYAVRAGYAQELEDIVAHYAALGLRRIAVLRPDDARGAAWAAAVRTALARRDLTAAADVAVKATNVPSAVRSVLKPRADVLIAALPQPPVADVVRALRQAGTGAQIVVTSAADAASLARELGPGGAGVVISQVLPPLEQVSLPVISEYRRAYAAETGGERYSPASLEAYLGAKLLADALERIGRDLSRDKLQLALEAMTAHDLGGHLVRYSRSARSGSDRNYLLAIDREGQLLH